MLLSPAGNAPANPGTFFAPCAARESVETAEAAVGESLAGLLPALGAEEAPAEAQQAVRADAPGLRPIPGPLHARCVRLTET